MAVLVGGRWYSLIIEPAELVDEQRALVARGVRDALLDHVGGELVLRQLQHLAAHRRHQPRPILRRTVLQHVLHHVVAVLVLRYRTSIIELIKSTLT